LREPGFFPGKFFLAQKREKKMLASLAAQRAAFDPQGPLALPPLVCVAAFYPLTTRWSMGGRLVMPAEWALGPSGSRARAMRRAAERASAAVTATELAAVVTEHLLERASLARAEPSALFSLYLARVGVPHFWRAARASLELSPPFRAVEAERLRALRRMRAARPDATCVFFPETLEPALAELALAAMRLYERLLDEWPLRAKCPFEYCELAAECAVCLCDAHDAARLACGHVFCAACIRRWLLAAETCPVCRAVALSCSRCAETGRIWEFSCCRSGAYCSACVPCDHACTQRALRARVR
jgi:hypothetical protein